MPQQYDIVIIGAGFGGLTAAHHLLKNVLPSLETVGREYKVTIISPASKFFHRISAPRALINPSLQALDAGLKDIAPGLEPYGDRIELVLGSVKSVNHAEWTVKYDGTEGNASGTVTYHALIIASGADATDGAELWGVTPGVATLRRAYEDVHSRLDGVKSILIGGGGPVGVETAGELLDRYGKAKDITILSGTTRLLASIDNQRFGHDAENKLASKGVKVIHGVRVSGVGKNADGSASVKLDNGESRNVDMYLPSSGLKSNIDFLPVDWVDSDGRAKCSPHTFRLDVPDIQNVYAFGSVASYSDGTLFDVKFAYKALGESFRVDQLKDIGQTVEQKSLYNSKLQNRDLQLTPLGRSDGVIIIKGWRLPWFLCVLIKSRTFFVEQSPEYTHGKGI